MKDKEEWSIFSDPGNDFKKFLLLMEIFVQSLFVLFQCLTFNRNPCYSCDHRDLISIANSFC